MINDKKYLQVTRLSSEPNPTWQSPAFSFKLATFLPFHQQPYLGPFCEQILRIHVMICYVAR